MHVPHLGAAAEVSCVTTSNGSGRCQICGAQRSDRAEQGATLVTVAKVASLPEAWSLPCLENGLPSYCFLPLGSRPSLEWRVVPIIENVKREACSSNVHHEVDIIVKELQPPQTTL